MHAVVLSCGINARCLQSRTKLTIWEKMMGTGKINNVCLVRLWIWVGSLVWSDGWDASFVFVFTHLGQET